MTLLQIVQIGHPVLRTPARPLSAAELSQPRWQTFIDDLVATMRAANGAGLAANQVAEAVRVCALEVKADNPRYPYKPAIPLTIVLNPQVEPLGEDTFLNYEGCLSVPDLRGLVRRHRRVLVRYIDRHGQPVEHLASGLEAATFQHEIDHLDGRLFVDRVEDPASLCTWDNFTRYHRDRFVESLRAEGLIA